MFRCHNGVHCVHSALSVCDGHPHCPDGSDEDEAVCAIRCARDDRGGGMLSKMAWRSPLLEREGEILCLHRLVCDHSSHFK